MMVHSAVFFIVSMREITENTDKKGTRSGKLLNLCAYTYANHSFYFIIVWIQNLASLHLFFVLILFQITHC